MLEKMLEPRSCEYRWMLNLGNAERGPAPSDALSKSAAQALRDVPYSSSRAKAALPSRAHSQVNHLIKTTYN